MGSGVCVQQIDRALELLQVARLFEGWLTIILSKLVLWNCCRQGLLLDGLRYPRCVASISLRRVEFGFHHERSLDIDS